MDKPPKSKVSITLDENIIADIRELSQKDDRSFSQYINMVLRDYLVKLQKSDSEKNRK